MHNNGMGGNGILCSVDTYNNMCLMAIILTFYIKEMSGPGSSFGIATEYGVDGPGSNPGGDEIFRMSRPEPGAHPSSCKMGTGSFLEVKCGRGVLLISHRPSSAAVMEE